MARRSSCANQLSTAFSHEALVGVKWKWTRGCRSSHASTAGVVCVLLLSRMRWRSSSSRCGAVDLSQEGEEFFRAVSGGDPTDDVAGCNIKCCVQTGGAVPRVVVRAPLHLSWTKLEQRLRAIQGLHLRLLIHAENQRVVRRIQIEADDVDDFLGESRVVAHLECSHRCGLRSAAVQTSRT